VIDRILPEPVDTVVGVTAGPDRPGVLPRGEPSVVPAAEAATDDAP
jgi:hypothetical protein